MRNLSLRIVVFFAINLPISSIAQQFNFKNFSINEGLSQPYVYTINQGKYGTIWIGTGEGLNRFDGKKFEIYGTKDGLAENFVTQSFKDSQNNIWFGHFQGGISLYDNNKFSTISKSIASSPIHTFAQDSLNNIWVGTQSNGLIKIKPNHTIEKFENSLKDLSINSLLSISNDLLWVGTAEGLKIFKNTSKQPIFSTGFLDYVEISQMARLSKNEILVATKDEGIYLFSKVNNVWNFVPIEANISLKNKNLNILKIDHEKQIWLGCYGESISKFSLSDNKLKLISNYSQKSGLAINYIKDIYIDRDHNVWMGTFGSGVELLLDPLFTLYTSKDGLIGNKISSVISDNNNLWISIDASLQKIPFNKYEVSNQLDEIRTFKNITDQSSITSIINDPKGNIFVGTKTKGLWYFDTQKNKCTQIFYNASNKISNVINHLALDKKNNVWVATENGAYRFDYKSLTKPNLHLTMEDGLLHNNIYSIFADSKNNIWFATHGSGISTLVDGNIINYPSPNANTGLDANCFTQDKLGNIWIGTYGQGLYKISNNKKFTKITLKDGLGSNYVYSIFCDADNNIWAGHKNGLSKWITKQNKFIFYQKKDGFLAEELSNNCNVQDESNNIWLGTNDGLLKYNLQIEKNVKSAPSVLFTSIDLFFQKTDWSKYADSLFTLSKIPRKLTLPHNQNHLTFHFNGISFTNPDKISFQYRLLGFDQEWSLVTKEDFVTYPNIPPGKYTFQVVASNHDGIWTQNPAEFEFVILNPFWKRWWFLLLVLLITIFIFIAILKIRTMRLEAKQKQLQEEKEKLLAEITERKRAERKLKESEDRLKETNQELNTFIYRASHDLRGPLSTVKGLTNLAQMEIKDNASLKYFGLISDRINRLDFILKDLINIVEVTDVPINAKELNIEQVLAETIEKVKEEFSDCNIHFDIVNTRKNSFLGDSRIVQNILYNLIDNAVKYSSPEKSDTKIKISIDDYKNGILFVIEDNGIGIAKEIQHKVFDMFFRGTDQSKGSGLGLYLVKKIVNRISGKIVINSIPKVGTQVEVYLPNFMIADEKQTEKETSKSSIPFMDNF